MNLTKYVLRSLFALAPVLSITAIVPSSTFAQSDDIDIEAAQRAVSAAESAERSAESEAADYYRYVYKPAQAVADQKQRVYEEASSRYDEVARRASSYQTQVEQAKNRANQARNQQQSLRNQISNLDSSDSQLNNRINSLRNERVTVQSDIRSLETRISNEESKPVDERDQDLILRLRNQRDEKYNRRDQIENEITQAQDQISQNSRLRNSYYSEISSLNSTISSAEADQRSAQSNVDALQGELSARRSEMEAANSVYQAASSEARSKYATYETDYYNPWQAAKYKAASARSYLAKVQANYNRERDRVVSVATKAGQTAGGEEAKMIAGQNASDQGAKDGSAEGEKLGAQDASLVSYSRGYKQGRDTAMTAEDLKTSYSQGYAVGVSLANEKAQKENYPKGYNELLESVLKTPSAQIATIDLDEERAPEIVDEGALLNNLPQDVGSMAEPVRAFPGEPAEQTPAAGEVTIKVPTVTYSQSNPSCDVQRRQEFVQLCKDNYKTGYSSGYQASYRSLYTEKYKAVFTASAKEAYLKTRNQVNTDSKEQGRQTGAKDQGVLNGYAQRYPTATVEYYEAGKKQFAALRAQAYLPIVRSAKLVEAVSDGVYLPGEAVQLQLQIDNVGAKGVNAEDLRAVVKVVKGLKDISATERMLPELKPLTLLTLNNVFKGTIDGTLSGSPLLVEGVIVDKSGQEVAQFKVAASLRFPVELSKVDISTRLPLNTWVNVPFTFTNPSSQKSTERVVFVSSSPTSVEINNPNGVKVPAMEPGQSKTVNLAIRPGFWVGEGQNVDFVTKIMGNDNQVIGTQNLTKALYMNRAAALIPVDAQNRPVPHARFTVKAGSRVTLAMLYRYLDQTNQRFGPFVIAAMQSSDPRIAISQGTSISYNYGAATPRQQDQRLTFTYNIPADLKGKTVWVAAELREGSGVWQRQQIWLEVQ